MEILESKTSCKSMLKFRFRLDSFFFLCFLFKISFFNSFESANFMHFQQLHCNDFPLTFVLLVLSSIGPGKARLTYSTSNIKLIVLHQKNCAESSSILYCQHTVRESVGALRMRRDDVLTMFVVLDECSLAVAQCFHLSILRGFHHTQSPWDDDDVGKDFHNFFDFPCFVALLFSQHCLVYAS